MLCCVKSGVQDDEDWAFLFNAVCTTAIQQQQATVVSLYRSPFAHPRYNYHETVWMASNAHVSISHLVCCHTHVSMCHSVKWPVVTHNWYSRLFFCSLIEHSRKSSSAGNTLVKLAYIRVSIARSSGRSKSHVPTADRLRNNGRTHLHLFLSLHFVMSTVITTDAAAAATAYK